MFLSVLLCTGMGVLRDCGPLRMDFCAQAWGFSGIVYVSECTSMHRHGGFKGLWALESGLLCTGMGVLRA